MKILIVDDSRLARSEIKRLLDQYPATEICGEAATAEEARILIKKKEPDILLLDIEMPGENAFSLLSSLDEVPAVIFTTAYQEFAVKAFEENAVDYLLKPIEPNRLQKALERVSLVQEPQSKVSSEKIGLEEKVFVRDNNKCYFIKLSDVRFFETCGNYSKVYFDTNKILVSKSLNYLQQRLDNSKFFRANRQFIINLNHVVEIRPKDEAYEVKMSCEKTIRISRRNSQKLHNQLRF